MGSPSRPDGSYPRSTPPVRLPTSATIFAAERVDLLRRSWSSRAAGWSPRWRSTSCRARCPGLRRRRTRVTPAISLRSTLCAARTMSAAFTRAIDHEGEVALDRLERRQLEHRLGARRPSPCGSGMRSRITSKATSGPSASSASSARGCSSPKWPSTFCGPIWMVPERPGWNQAGPPGTTCSACAGAPAAASTASASALASKASTVAGLARPVAADAGALGQRAAHAGRGGELVLRLVALENLPDLEQRHVGKAAVGVLLRGRDQAGNQARPHVGEFGRDRIGERQLRLAAAEQFGLRLGDERPGHGLDQAARGERALGLAGAHLDRR